MNKFLSLTKNKIFNSEIEINKSRFLGFAKYVETVDQAKSYVLELKKQYRDAKHVVYAYMVDGAQKSTDDGEPTGTAGRPMLEFLGHLGCNNIVVVVVRYFGGIKLGTGGLLRAYVGTAQKTIEGNLKNYERAKLFEGEFSYADFEIFKRNLRGKNAKIVSTQFSENVKIELVSFDEQFEKLNYVGDVFETLEDGNGNN